METPLLQLPPSYSGTYNSGGILYRKQIHCSHWCCNQFFLIFNLAQTKIWHTHFWLSLINSFVVKSNTLELKELNTQLNNEILEHKQTALKIAVSRKKLQDIYNSAHDGIFILSSMGR